jgi:hypothetical protein
MGRLPENVLGERRSPAQALADLVEKYHRTVLDHPVRPKLARMIQQLRAEIAYRTGEGYCSDCGF